MIFTLHDTDDGPVLELDDEAIDYLSAGLERLADAEPGDEFASPCINADGVGDFTLRKAGAS